MSAPRPHHDANEGRAKPSSPAHPNASMPVGGPYGKSQCCGGRGRNGKQSNVGTKKKTPKRKTTRMIRQTLTSAEQDDIACRGNTHWCREIWGKFPAALGQADGAGKVPACAPHEGIWG